MGCLRVEFGPTTTLTDVHSRETAAPAAAPRCRSQRLWPAAAAVTPLGRSPALHMCFPIQMYQCESSPPRSARNSTQQSALSPVAPPPSLPPSSRYAADCLLFISPPCSSVLSSSFSCRRRPLHDPNARVHRDPTPTDCVDSEKIAPPGQIGSRAHGQGLAAGSVASHLTWAHPPLYMSMRAVLGTHMGCATCATCALPSIAIANHPTPPPSASFSHHKADADRTWQ